MRWLDRLEHARGGPFTYRHRGEVRGLPSPQETRADLLLRLVRAGDAIIPMDMPLWKRELLVERWRAHYDLPDARQCERLFYLIDRFAPEAEADLRIHYNGADLREMWQQREWRRLLSWLDRLPSHSYLNAALSNDEEHAKALFKAMSESDGSSKPSGPSLTSWTPEVAVGKEILDAVRHLDYVLQAVNSPKGKSPKPPQPSPRPKTAFEGLRERAEHHRRQAKHQSLVARLLPRKAKPGD